MTFSPPAKRGEHAEALVAQLFRSHGWEVEASNKHDPFSPDLTVTRGNERFAVEIKAHAEGRPDRVIPSLSKAILQAQAYARRSGGLRPMAVVYVEEALPSLLAQVHRFAENYAPDIPIGIASEDGFKLFVGGQFGDLISQTDVNPAFRSNFANQAFNLFSDLNQWMLKVLLAPDIPDGLLGAPRNRYTSGAELAKAAGVSSMSASRFLFQLRQEGFLNESSMYFDLVRRDQLFRRWQAAMMRSMPETPASFLIKAPLLQQIKRLMDSRSEQLCLGLFAAADQLRLGHVRGVPPYIYVPKLPRPHDEKWKGLMMNSEGPPDVIFREAPFPKSIFRGAVHVEGVMTCDVIQVWLDVSIHPSRGQEQADLISKKVLTSILKG